MNDPFLTYFFHVSPEKISLFRFLLEGYDGLAVLSTLDARAGLVRLLVPESRCPELRQLLSAISDDLCLQELES